MELTALALPADPFALGLIPDASAVQEDETLRAAGARVALVQLRDPRPRRCHQVIVGRTVLVHTVHPVRKQREREVFVRICEIVYFKTLNVLCDRSWRRQEGWDHDDRAKLRR